MQPVAKGTTKKFIKLGEVNLVEEFTSVLTEDFTGRLQGVMRSSKGELEIVIEILNGEVIAAGIKGFTNKLGKDAVEEVVKTLPESTGFIEIVELDKEAIKLDLEFNPKAKLEEPIKVKTLMEKISSMLEKVVETPTTKVEEEVKTEERKVDVEEIISKLKISNELDRISTSLKEDEEKLVEAILKPTKEISKGAMELSKLLTEYIYSFEEQKQPLLLSISTNGDRYLVIVFNNSITAAYILDTSTNKIKLLGLNAVKDLIEKLWDKNINYVLSALENNYILEKLGVKKEVKEKPKGILGRLKKLFGGE